MEWNFGMEVYISNMEFTLISFTFTFFKSPQKSKCPWLIFFRFSSSSVNSSDEVLKCVFVKIMWEQNPIIEPIFLATWTDRYQSYSIYNVLETGDMGHYIVSKNEYSFLLLLNVNCELWTLICCEFSPSQVNKHTYNHEGKTSQDQNWGDAFKML